MAPDPQFRNEHTHIPSSESSLSADDSAETSLAATAQQQQPSSAFYFLSPTAARELPHYTYKGQDQSLLYAYVLSPLAGWCVDHLTPRWMAPNAITLLGLAFMIAAYCVMWWYVPTLESSQEEEEEVVPNWIFLYNAIAILLYQTLDNMDGKQARRTQSSSPLGLLFDHGCDAVNSLFGSANWMISMGLHPRKSDAWLCWIILFGPYALFYVGTWEEYYTGELVMPIVNGPNEGLMGAVLMSLTSFVYGPEFWQGTSWWSQLCRVLPFLGDNNFGTGLRNCDLLVLASTFGFVQETSLKIFSTARKYGGKVLWNLVPFASLMACSLAVAYTNLDIWLDMPRTSLHLCAVLFVEMTTELMLSHMSKETYRPFRWLLLPLLFFTIAVVSGIDFDTQTYLLVYASGAAVFLCMRTAILIHEICTLLQIWCFDITTPRKASSSFSEQQVQGLEQHVKVE